MKETMEDRARAKAEKNPQLFNSNDTNQGGKFSHWYERTKLLTYWTATSYKENVPVKSLQAARDLIESTGEPQWLVVVPNVGIGPAPKRFFYYTIERDETELGGEMVVEETYMTWSEAKKAWAGTNPDPAQDVSLWFVRRDRSDPDYWEDLDTKPEEAHPLSFKNLERLLDYDQRKKVKVKKRKGLRLTQVQLQPRSRKT